MMLSNFGTFLDPFLSNEPPSKFKCLIFPSKTRPLPKTQSGYLLRTDQFLASFYTTPYNGKNALIHLKSFSKVLLFGDVHTQHPTQEQAMRMFFYVRYGCTLILNNAQFRYIGSQYHNRIDKVGFPPKWKILTEKVKE